MKAMWIPANTKQHAKGRGSALKFKCSRCGGGYTAPVPYRTKTKLALC